MEGSHESLLRVVGGPSSTCISPGSGPASQGTRARSTAMAKAHRPQPGLGCSAGLQPDQGIS